jgi:PST family polysaccharide transporter
MGLAEVGIFSVGWFLSMRFLSIIITSFGTYYLPTLSRSSGNQAKALVINDMQRAVIMGMTPLIVMAVALKPLIVRLLYSDQFLPAIHLVRWMLIADFIRFSGWVLGMLLLVDTRLKVFLWKDIFLKLFLFACASVSVRVYASIEYIGVGYLLMSLMNLIYLLWFVKITYGYIFKKGVIMAWCYGLLLILSASYIYWNKTKVDYGIIPLFILSLLLFFFSISQHQKNLVNDKFNLVVNYLRRIASKATKNRGDCDDL